MKLIIPPEVVTPMTQALLAAGKREIGGVLMGEHVSPDTFRVKKLTIQRRGGTFAHFVRLVEEIIGPLKSFFRRTGYNYTKFNYLGEWHSHHSFSLRPSSQDRASMMELINDPGLGAHFLVLLLVKIENKTLAGNLIVYQPGHLAFEGKLIIQSPQG